MQIVLHSVHRKHSLVFSYHFYIEIPPLLYKVEYNNSTYVGFMLSSTKQNILILFFETA